MSAQVPQAARGAVAAGQLACLSATDVYRYLSQEHEATTIGVLLGMAAAHRCLLHAPCTVYAPMQTADAISQAQRCLSAEQIQSADSACHHSCNEWHSPPGQEGPLQHRHKSLPTALQYSFMAAADACRATMDATTSKMLFLHVPSRHPATYPELELSPLVQAAALLGIGLVYQGSCHRCDAT